MLVSADESECRRIDDGTRENILLLIFEQATVKDIVWGWQFSFSSAFWIDDFYVHLLTEVPCVEVFGTDVPDANIVK